MTELTPEERQHIYEEEKARAEANKQILKEEEDKKAKKGVIGFLAVVIGLIVWVAITPTDDSEPVQTTPAPTTQASSPSVGENAVMANLAMLAVDDEAWDAMIDAQVADDTIGLRSLLLSGDAFLLEESTRVLVLDKGFFSTRVRALEGDNMGKAGWVQFELVTR